MKIKYFGTAAAEGIPALFCDCKICQNARKVGGKEIKTRSQALVDDKILIDFPADTYMHSLYGGLDLKNIKTLLISHCHADHLYERDFWCRIKGIANNIPEEPLHVYAGEYGFEQIKKWYDAKMSNSDRLKIHKVVPFISFLADGYKITPLEANHDALSSPLIYIIEKDDKKLLYAHDTGVFPESTWDFLSRLGGSFDFISIDCTGMLLKDYRRHHLCLDTDNEVIERLRAMGLVDSSTTVYVNHFSHNGEATHDQLVECAEKYGFGVTYDGLEIEF